MKRTSTPASMRFNLRAALTFCLLIILTAVSAFPQAQSNAADLQGYVRDPQGAVVTGASVTARNPATGSERTATTNDEGFYQIVNLPPGEYEVTVEAANFKRAVLSAVRLTVGQRADLDVPLELGNIGETVTVTSASTEVVESSRTAVATTVDQQRIDNLPVNQRDYLSIALTTSTVGRDNGRPIGPAPTSGLNFGGQRGRSNLVQVDGADNTDNSINASRSTVSQEAVQEFQVISNSYAPEFGRAAGGVVNVVTKGGTNDFRGNAFGFIRHKSIQARNPFAPLINNDPDEKPPYTRTQSGVTLGGPIVKDRTFFFFAFERRQRNESGFFTSNVSKGLNSTVSVGPGTSLPVPIPFPISFANLTQQQAAFITSQLQTGLTTGNAARINATLTYAYETSGGGATALTGNNPLVSLGGSIPAGQVIGSRFFLSGAPVPVGTVNSQGLPIAFRPLLDLQRIFPVTDRTNFSSIRLDHHFNQNHILTGRFGYNPSDISGIQVESQNQSLGQNDFSRTGIQRLRDLSTAFSLNSTLSSRVVNEARFNYSRRRASFRSQNGEAVSFNISGTAFIGRELFSPVDRTETRFQYADNINVIAGNHTFKFGGDANFINVDATFELNFAGLFNFGSTDIRPFVPGSGVFPALPCPNETATGCTPLATPVQAYGLGLPGNFIQGFGNPVSKLSNKPFSLFAQDSWKARPNLTLNYGVRYDIELTEQLAPVGFRDPLTCGINPNSCFDLSAADILAAQDALNVQQGFPRDKNNIAPRVGLAWDITGDGKTVFRAAYGIFYDHPLLAAAFNSDIADAAQQQQGILTPGSPAPNALLNAVQVFQGTVCVPGQTCPFGAGVFTPGVAVGTNYQRGRQRFDDQTFPGFGPVLPFTLPVSKDFEYAYANQANLTIERQLTRDMSVSASYLFVGSHHLPHPLDVNAPRTDLQIANFQRYANRAPFSTTEAVAGILFPTTAPGSTFVNPITGETFAVVVPGLIIQGARGRVIQPAAANFFRPNAPNYFLVRSLTGLTPAAFDALIAGTLRTPGIVAPFGSVNAQVSDGNANYNAFNLDVKRRFANNFQFLASYTWSHSIDDSSDLQTLLLPQDNRNFRAERADSLFDQRHRFVFSGVVQSPEDWRKSGTGWRRWLSDFTIAPIIELSSGRPFNILTNVDTNNDQSTQTDRPNVAADGTLLQPPDFSSGSLGRNRGITHGYASVDLRVSRAIRFGERVRLDLIAEGFNLLNRFNEASASPFFQDVNAFGQRDGSGRYHSFPTASFDSRQFQFGAKISF